MSYTVNMLFVMSVGNSELAFGLFESGELRAHWKMPTAHDADADHHRSSLLAAMQEHSEELVRVDRTLIASVVPALQPRIGSAVRGVFGTEARFLGPDWETGLSYDATQADELGSNLIANCVGALSKYHDSCIIIDFGTTTTFTAIQGNRTILGTAIAPGILTSMDAMVRSTATLPFVRLSAPEHPIGKSTEEAVQSGLTFGYAALADGMAERFVGEIPGPRPRIVATGNFAHLIASVSQSIDTVEPLLSLEGLAVISEMNDG